MYKAGVFFAGIILIFASGDVTKAVENVTDSVENVTNSVVNVTDSVKNETDSVVTDSVKNVSSFDDFLAQSKGNKSFLLMNSVSCCNCTGADEQLKTICAENKEFTCFSSILADKEAIEAAFKNLSVERLPYLVYFNYGKEVCAFERECTVGDTNYISDGIHAALNCSTH